jgi:hypothetical protein
MEITNRRKMLAASISDRGFSRPSSAVERRNEGFTQLGIYFGFTLAADENSIASRSVLWLPLNLKIRTNEARSLT